MMAYLLIFPAQRAGFMRGGGRVRCAFGQLVTTGAEDRFPNPSLRAQGCVSAFHRVKCVAIVRYMCRCTCT